MMRDAEYRRQALEKFLKTRNLSRGALARQADISPNIVYNFLNGKSTYLSQPTLERISMVFRVPINVLTGEPMRGKKAVLNEFADASGEPQHYAPPATTMSERKALPLAGMIMGGVWSKDIFVEPDRTGSVTLDLPSFYAGKGFALKVLGPVMDELLPAGSIIACVGMADYLQALTSGDIVIMVRQNQSGLFPTTLKQYVVEDHKHYLISRSNDPRHREKVEILAPLNDPAALGHQDFFIHAIVLSYLATLPAASR